MQTSRIFRVFVSSTFSDLKAERNALQAVVFPRLRQLAAAHGYRFQAIDLRWGISDEAALDQQTMNICLGEIKRCQQVSPRPNFIILLGDRYGWCPPPPQISADDFEKILDSVQSNEDQTLLREWYRLDTNVIPPQWQLKPREKGSPYESAQQWQPIEARLHNILVEAVGKVEISPLQLPHFIASATEQEILTGARVLEEPPEHVLCFLRSIKGLPEGFDLQDFHIALDKRLKEAFPGGWSAACQNLIEQILETAKTGMAKGLFERIKQEMENSHTRNYEIEILNHIRQALVDFTGRDFQNLDELEWTVDAGMRTRQDQLKEQLRTKIPGRVYSYQAEWTGTGITTDHIEQLCKDVYDSLAGIILDEIEHPSEQISHENTAFHIQPHLALDEEGRAQHTFAEDRLAFFVGRHQLLTRIDEYIRASQHRNLVIVGPGGTGKSALMAKAIEQAQQAHPQAEIVYRFIGATAGSSDGRSLLESLCREIARRYSTNENNVPIDYRDLVLALEKHMQLARSNKPLILFLDSLDQLSASQDARSLVWLPNELPDHVSVITTTRSEDTLNALQAKQIEQENLGGLSREEGADLLTQWLNSAQRTLQPVQQEEVMEKFILSEGNPLFLKLAFEEARLWRSSDIPPEQLTEGVNGIIEKNLISRMQDEARHGEKMISHALGYLAATRYGLAEDEWIDLLSRDLEVYGWFFQRSYHLPADLLQHAINYLKDHQNSPDGNKNTSGKNDETTALTWLKDQRTTPEQVEDFLKTVLPKANGPRLPVVLWSRLFLDLAPYLTERLVDGTPLLNFYHRELGEAAKSLFLAGDRHRLFHTRLADYFRAKADPSGEHTWDGGHVHALSELPYHLTAAGKSDEVYNLLTDFNFLEHKAEEVGILLSQDSDGNPIKTSTGVLQLQEDFEYALAAMPGRNGKDANQPPLILTALETDQGLRVYCPVCNTYSPVQQEDLNMVITCPQENCHTLIWLNPFTIKRAA